ncbi:GDP-mannose 4,6-dehydratase [Candidatus Magnetaquicoccus inordinatus]|uniref:GDP-mannose 4,6-dehydratase n=1 Tax=Candidatus Magnetaquicoccus inordinatus TaxID=2496818 RepID=UPI00102B2299|nr:GDP-mannose 4,6-dehydratase [Candidatus Magnetaquicoccus inordinatus]
MSGAKPIAVVTGGAGFIGSHMVDLLLANGYRVRILDNLQGGHLSNLAHLQNEPDVHFEQGDIRDLAAESLLFRDVQHVYHFAGIGDIVPSMEQPIDYMATNVQGTVRVLEAARSGGRHTLQRFVYAASSSCYGLAATPTLEDFPIQPQYPYALSKNLGEQVVLHWRQVYDMPVNSLRIFNAYGPRVRTTGAYGAVFGVFFRQKLAGKPYTVVGDGTQTRDFIYVTDVARAFYMVACSDREGEIYNVGANNPQSVLRLVELLGGEVIFVPKRPGEPDCTWAETAKINREIGWYPQVDFPTGVRTMLQDIARWNDAPLWDPESIAKATESWFKYLGKER